MARKRTLTVDNEMFLQQDRQTKAPPGSTRTRKIFFTQGDVADAMFYVEAGDVKLTVLSKLGKKAVIAIFRQGDFFGEGCLGMPSLRMSSATAVQSATVTRVEKSHHRSHHP